MFSGKSTELIRRARRFQSIGKRVLIINSLKDTRCQDTIQTHDGKTLDATKMKALKLPSEFPDVYQGIEVVIIDEGQFFDNLEPFVHDIQKACPDVHVIVGGLDGDYQQKKFGHILDLIPMADTLIKLTGLCMFCQEATPAPFTKRLNMKHLGQEFVSDHKDYACVCRKHL